MHGNKTDQTKNGHFKKTLQHPWSKNVKIWVPELRLWLVVSRSLKKAEREKKVADFVERYRKQGPVNFGMEKGKV